MPECRECAVPPVIEVGCKEAGAAEPMPPASAFPLLFAEKGARAPALLAPAGALMRAVAAPWTYDEAAPEAKPPCCSCRLCR